MKPRLQLRRHETAAPDRDRGATVVEYALLLALVAVVSIGALAFLGRSTSDTFDAAAASIDLGVEAGSPSGGSGGGGAPGGADGPGGPSGPSGPGGSDGSGDGPGSGGDDSGSGDAGVGGTEAENDQDPGGAGDGGGSEAGGNGDGGSGPGGSDGDGAGSGGSDDGGLDPAAPGSSATEWGGTSATMQNHNHWQSSATVAVYGADGLPLSKVNAGVQIRVVQIYRTWDGKTQERSWTTESVLEGGTATFTNHPLRYSGNNQEIVVAMRYEVTNVVYHWPQNPDVRWDGAKPSVTVLAP